MSEKPLAMFDSLPEEVKGSMERLRNALLICMIKRSGGKVLFPVEEIDAADDLLTMTLDACAEDPKKSVFTVETVRRQ